MSGLQQYPQLEKRDSRSELKSSPNKSPIPANIAEKTKSMRSFWTDLEKSSGSNSPPMPDQISPILYSSGSLAAGASSRSPSPQSTSPSLERKSSLARQSSITRLHGPRGPGQSSPSKLKKVVTFEPSHEVIQYEAVTPEISYEDAENLRYQNDIDDANGGVICDDNDDDAFNVPVIEPGSFDDDEINDDDDGSMEEPPFVSSYLKVSRPLPQLPSSTPTLSDEGADFSHLESQKDRFLAQDALSFQHVPSPKPDEAIQDAINHKTSFKSPALSETSDDESSYEPVRGRDGKLMPATSLARKESILDSQRKVATEHVFQPEEIQERPSPYHVQRTMSQKRRSLNKVLEDVHNPNAVSTINELAEEDEEGEEEEEEEEEGKRGDCLDKVDNSDNSEEEKQLDLPHSDSFIPEVPADIPTGGSFQLFDSPETADFENADKDAVKAESEVPEEPYALETFTKEIKTEPLDEFNHSLSQKVSVSSLSVAEIPILPAPEDVSPLFAMNTPDLENHIAASTDEDTAPVAQPEPHSYLKPRIISHSSQEFRSVSTEEEVKVKMETPEIALPEMPSPAFGAEQEVELDAAPAELAPPSHDTYTTEHDHSIKEEEEVQSEDTTNKPSLSKSQSEESVNEYRPAEPAEPEELSTREDATSEVDSAEKMVSDVAPELLPRTLPQIDVDAPEIPPLNEVSPFLFSPAASEAATPYIGGDLAASSSIATMNKFTDALESERTTTSVGGDEAAVSTSYSHNKELYLSKSVEDTRPVTEKKHVMSSPTDVPMSSSESSSESANGPAVIGTPAVIERADDLPENDIGNVRIKTEPAETLMIPSSLRPPSLPFRSQSAASTPTSVSSEQNSLDYSNAYPETPQLGQNDDKTLNHWGFDDIPRSNSEANEPAERTRKANKYGDLATESKENNMAVMTTIRSSSGSKARPSAVPLEFGRGDHGNVQLGDRDNPAQLRTSIDLPLLQLGDDGIFSSGGGGGLFMDDMKGELDKILGAEEDSLESVEIPEQDGGHSPRKVGYVLREHEPVIVKSINTPTHKINRRKVSGPVRSLAGATDGEVERWNGPPPAPLAARKKPAEAAKPANPPSSERKITEATALTGPAAPSPLIPLSTLSDVSNSPVTLRSHIRTEPNGQQNDMPTSEKGRLYLRVISVKDINLPGIQSKNAHFNLTLDNGIHCITTENGVLKSGESKLEEEFELTVGEDLEFILTLKAKWNKTQRVVRKQVAPAPGAMKPVISQTQEKQHKNGLSRLFGGHKRLASNASTTSLGANGSQRQQPVAYKEVIEPDTWEYLVAGDGSFARAYVDFSQYENIIYGKPATIELICFNEWARSSDTLKRKDPYKVARFSVEMLFIPRVSKREILPRSIKDAMAELSCMKDVEPVHMEGALAQLGGDCKFWRRRFFKLDGVNLVAHSESSKKPRASINLAKANAIVDDRNELSQPVVVNGRNRRKSGFAEQENGQMYIEEGFRIKFSNGEVIDFYADSAIIKQQWLDVLNKVVGNPAYAHSPWIDAVINRQRKETQS